MRITFLGTGAGPGSAERSSAGILVETPEGPLLLDCGPGVVSNFSYAGLSASDIRAVLISHLHFDHVSGPWPLFSLAAFFESALPDVIGPGGTVEVVSKLNDLLATQMAQMECEVRGSARVSEASTRQDFDVLGVCIRARTTQHVPGMRSFCYRLEAGGQSIVYSGDTSPQKEIFADLAGGVDVLVHEAYSVAELESCTDGAPPAEVAHRARVFPKVHTSAEDAAKIATAAGAKRLILTHIPGWNTVDAILDEAHPHFSGELTIAYDGLVIEI